MNLFLNNISGGCRGDYRSWRTMRIFLWGSVLLFYSGRCVVPQQALFAVIFLRPTISLRSYAELFVFYRKVFFSIFPANFKKLNSIYWSMFQYPRLLYLLVVPCVLLVVL